MLRRLDSDVFRVDRDGGVPVGTQLAWRLRRLIASGRLAPGDRLPSVREMADAAGVNVNTVRSVYGRLEERGYIISRQGSGTFVAARARSSDRLERLERLAADLDEGARRAGLDPYEVAAHLYGDARVDLVRAPERHEPPAGDRRDVETRQQLRRQIAALEAELARHPAAAPAKPPSGRAGGGAVLSAEELAAVRDDLRARLRSLETAREEVIRRLDAVEAPGERRAARRAPRRSASSTSLVGARVRWVGVE